MLITSDADDTFDKFSYITIAFELSTGSAKSLKLLKNEAELNILLISFEFKTSDTSDIAVILASSPAPPCNQLLWRFHGLRSYRIFAKVASNATCGLIKPKYAATCKTKLNLLGKKLFANDCTFK